MLIGEVAARAALFAPVAFLSAAVVAAFTAFSYAELCARHPRSAGEAVYVEEVFHQPWLSGLVGWAVVLIGTASAATLANGFVGYLKLFLSMPDWLVIGTVVIALWSLAAWGISQSVISLIAVLNGALIQIIMASRVTYGMSQQRIAPSVFARVNPHTRTPVRATLVITVMVLILALWLPLVALAQATSFITLIVFALVNLSLWRLKLRGAPPEGVGVYPLWVPITGFTLCIGLVIAQIS